MSERQIASVADAVAAAQAALAAVDTTSMTDAELAAHVVQVRRLGDTAEAVYTMSIGVFHTRGVAEAGEKLHTRQWARHHLNIAPGDTGRALRVAKAVRQLPRVRAAFMAGQIRLPHAAAIAEAVTDLGIETIAACEQGILDAAVSNDPSRLRAALRGIGASIGDDKQNRRNRRRHHPRWLDVATTFDGAVSIQGVLDAETGAIVHAAIDAYAKPAGADDTRAATVRRADALTDICTHATTPRSQRSGSRSGGAGDPDDNASSGASDDSDTTVTGDTDDSCDHRGNGDTDDHTSSPHDGSGGHDRAGGDRARDASAPSDTGTREAFGHPGSTTDTGGTSGAGSGCSCRGRGSGRPSIFVVCDIATLMGASGGFGELATGDIIGGEAVRRLACDASITRIITGPNSMPLDVGRAQRTATPAQIKALRIRDGGCRFPGCDRPPEWCDVHHVRFWAHGGVTSVDNLILLCRKHHTAVHEHGWTINVAHEGTFVFHDPDGRPVGSGRDPTLRETINHITTSIRSRSPAHDHAA